MEQLSCRWLDDVFDIPESAPSSTFRPNFFEADMSLRIQAVKGRHLSEDVLAAGA